jgi:hypothetical protein
MFAAATFGQLLGTTFVSQNGGYSLVKIGRTVYHLSQFLA